MKAKTQERACEMKKQKITAGERIVFRRLKETLPNICKSVYDLRNKACLAPSWKEAKDYDRAVARAVKAALNPVKRCEGCNRRATTHDSEGVPLCKACYDVLDHEMPKPSLAKTIKPRKKGPRNGR